MEILYFIKVLLRHKWLILVVSLLAFGTAFWFLRQNPKIYKSITMLSTGIVDKQGLASDAGGYVQPYKVENQFSNIIELMYSRAGISLLSDKLLEHDLKAVLSGNDLAFREIDTTVHSFNKLDQLYQWHVSDTIARGRLSDDLQLFKNRLLHDMGYNFRSLRSNFAIERAGTTDYLRVAFSSENPGLSEFAVNNYSNDFITFHTRNRMKNSNSSVDFFKNMAREKKTALDGKVSLLKQYKLDNKVLNLDEQTRSTVSQIRDLEIKREVENKKIPSYRKNIANLNRYIDKGNAGNSVQQYVNKDISKLRRELEELNNQYISSGSKDQRILNRINNIKRQLEIQIQQSASRSPNARASGDDLLEKRINAEMELETAIAGVESIDRELARLRSQVSDFVNKEAVIKQMEREIEVEAQEYTDIIDKFNAAQLQSLNSTDLILSVIEPGHYPDKPEPDKLIFTSALAGIAGLTLSSVFIFALAYLDRSLNSPSQFRKFAGTPLVNAINKAPVNKIDFERLFVDDYNDAKIETFKHAIRKTRFDIEASGGKSILFTATRPSQGKTFLITSLSYALCISNKKVLIIDTNFKNNTLTRLPVNERRNWALSRFVDAFGLSRFFPKSGTLFNHGTAFVDVIGCEESAKSPSEIFSGTDFGLFLKQLLLQYDYVFMEGAALNDYVDTKELINYVDKVVCVFAAQTEMKEPDHDSVTYLLNRPNNQYMGALLNKVSLRNMDW